MTCTWCTKFLPWNSGFRSSISPRMQPTDQQSTAVEYGRCGARSTSGQRYQRVTTYSVSGFLASSAASARAASAARPATHRERPKSVMRTRQSRETRTLPGFRSRCRMPTLCRAWTPSRIWHSMHETCSAVRTCLDETTRCRSESMSSMTMKRSSEPPGRSTASWRLITFGCPRSRCMSRSSRSVCRASQQSSAQGLTRLIATRRAPASCASTALQTTP
mmetsp:Transcript_24591/g.69182  ORF Transcript_24591/g.69182 Transcript_24591/m.69182 type:complete len:219 (-) Transcript_24591:203-859(-)